MVKELSFGLEYLVAMTEFKKIDFESINHHHMHGPGDFPGFRWDVRDFAWKIDVPDNNLGLHDQLINEWWELTWDDEKRMFKDEHGFEICTDENGYAIIGIIEIMDAYEELKTQIENFYNSDEDDYDDSDARWAFETFKKRLNETEIFEEWAKQFKKYDPFEEYVVLEDDEGHFRIAHPALREDNETIWDADIEDKKEDACLELEGETIIDAVKRFCRKEVRGFVRNIELAKNSMIG